MAFVALVMKLLEEDAVHFSEEKIDANRAIGVSPRELLATANRDLVAALQPALERGTLTLAIIRRSKLPWCLRVTALTEEGLISLSTLLQAFAMRPVLRWQQQRWRVEVTGLERSPWARTSSWADFLDKPAGSLLRFQLGTPLVVPSSTEAGEWHTSPFPHPLPVFTELARRWRALGGPSLPADAPSMCEQAGCVVVDYSLRSCPLALPQRHQPGLLGWVTYMCRSKSMDRVAALSGLARFAFFAGVGCYTADGMGATRVTIGP